MTESLPLIALLLAGPGSGPPPDLLHSVLMGHWGGDSAGSAGTLEAIPSGGEADVKRFVTGTACRAALGFLRPPVPADLAHFLPLHPGDALTLVHGTRVRGAHVVDLALETDELDDLCPALAYGIRLDEPAVGGVQAGLAVPGALRKGALLPRRDLVFGKEGTPALGPEVMARLARAVPAGKSLQGGTRVEADLKGGRKLLLVSLRFASEPVEEEGAVACVFGWALERGGRAEGWESGPPTSYCTEVVAVTDLDGDGDPEVVLLHSAAEEQQGELLRLRRGHLESLRRYFTPEEAGGAR